MLLEAGLSATTVAARLGHSPAVTMRIYAGVMSGSEVRENEKIQILLEG
jgi:hypothetical protein